MDCYETMIPGHTRQIKVLSIIGTRPEAIKMAPVIKQLSRAPEKFHSIVCVTGQHREMLHQVLQIFGITPDIDLDCMTPNQSLFQLTARLFERIGGVLDNLRPDWVLAQGDTTSVFVSAMSAYYSNIRFAHVEAGLRTGDNRHPFPEEINRKFSDELADVCFAPTEHSRDRLLQEGCQPGKVVLTGNTVVDALMDISERPFSWIHSQLAPLVGKKRLVLVTAHRRESFGEPIRQICRALQRIAESCADENIHLVFPVHPNPEVRIPAFELLCHIPNITLLDPLDYVSFVHLMKASVLILTDSGGIQEEAPGLGVPVLIMRDLTERPEGVHVGAARLVGTCSERIAEAVINLLRDPDQLRAMCCSCNPYGDGRAAERIVAALSARCVQ